MKWTMALILSGLLATATALAGEQNITGTVEKTDSGFVISAQDGNTYMVQGRNLADMVGKTVMATGILAESESGKTVIIVNVEEAQGETHNE